MMCSIPDVTSLAPVFAPTVAEEPVVTFDGVGAVTHELDGLNERHRNAREKGQGVGLLAF